MQNSKNKYTHYHFLRTARVLLCGLCLCFLSTNIGAQIHKNYSTDIRGFYTSGHIGQHSENITHAMRGFTHGVEIIACNIIPATSRLNDRQKMVFLDLGFHYTNYSQDYMGQTFAFTFGRSETFLEKNRFKVSGQFLHGFGYTTQPYSQTNNKNNAISTHLGFHINANLTASYAVSKNWQALLGVSFNHLSNGAIKKPNLGYNVLATNVGIAYHVQEKEIKDDYAYYADSRKYYLHIIGSYFNTASSSFSEEKYPSYTFHTQLERNLSIHHSLLLGIDYNYNDKTLYADETIHFNESDNNSHTLGISLSGSWKYSFVDFNLGAGLYLLKPWYYEAHNYFLVQFKFYALKNIYLIGGLRAHNFRAVAFETGLGIKI